MSSLGRRTKHGSVRPISQHQTSTTAPPPPPPWFAAAVVVPTAPPRRCRGRGSPPPPSPLFAAAAAAVEVFAAFARSVQREPSLLDARASASRAAQLGAALALLGGDSAALLVEVA